MTKVLDRIESDTSAVTLIVHQTRTSEDKTAEKLVRAQFNGRTDVAERQNAIGELLPTLWVEGMRLRGLKSIRSFITGCNKEVKAR